MIISVEEMKRYINTDEDDQALGARLQALESLVRRYTNNNFQVRAFRHTADIHGGAFHISTPLLFRVGDTVEVGQSIYNEGLYTVQDVGDGTFTVQEDVREEDLVLVTKVEYPADVKMGVCNLLKWEMEKRDKVGIQSESISRHSVTYYNMDGDNTVMGYPKSLLGFLRPYMKARFGQGVRA